MTSNMINFDSSNWNEIIDLMDTYGDSENMFSGNNEDGEDVFMSISHDNVSISTFQKNGFVRVNTYWRDHTTEETFNGRWNK